MRSPLPWVLTVALVAASIAPARAGNWPTPAAGSSASGDPEVLFTFDDGPAPRTTTKVLDILAERDIQAIFFLVGDRLAGSSEASRALVDRMIREGHIVANHSKSHPNLCVGKAEAAIAEVEEARELIEALARMPVPWFRAPYGAWCPRLVDLVEGRGLTHFFWDIDPQEWKTGSASTTKARVIAGLRRLKGRAIILLHDTKPATVKALPEILDWIDEENARRATKGQRPIRILDAPDYALEQLGAEAVAEAAAITDDLLGALAGGLASALP